MKFYENPVHPKNVCNSKKEILFVNSFANEDLDIKLTAEFSPILVVWFVLRNTLRTSLVKKRVTKLVDAFANLYSRYIMEVFDYIVVGAGSARCVLATRLTERSNFIMV